MCCGDVGKCAMEDVDCSRPDGYHICHLVVIKVILSGDVKTQVSWDMIPY
jgi:hypothetical protein